MLYHKIRTRERVSCLPLREIMYLCGGIVLTVARYRAGYCFPVWSMEVSPCSSSSDTGTTL